MPVNDIVIELAFIHIQVARQHPLDLAVIRSEPDVQVRQRYVEAAACEADVQHSIRSIFNIRHTSFLLSQAHFSGGCGNLPFEYVLSKKILHGKFHTPSNTSYETKAALFEERSYLERSRNLIHAMKGKANILYHFLKRTEFYY
jgi:hypothetical protein